MALNGTKGMGEINYFPNGTCKVSVQVTPTEQVTLPSTQIVWFEKNGFRYEPVKSFTLLINGKKRLRIDHDFAIVSDTGRISLYIHHLLLSPSLAAHSYLLRVRGQHKLYVIHDSSNKFEDGAFSSRVQMQLLEIFVDDPNLRQLLADQKLTCRNFSSYVRTYNELFSSVR